MGASVSAMGVRLPLLDKPDEAELLDRSRSLIAEMDRLIERAKQIRSEYRQTAAALKQKQMDKTSGLGQCAPSHSPAHYTEQA